MLGSNPPPSGPAPTPPRLPPRSSRAFIDSVCDVLGVSKRAQRILIEHDWSLEEPTRVTITEIPGPSALDPIEGTYVLTPIDKSIDDKCERLVEELRDTLKILTRQAVAESDYTSAEELEMVNLAISRALPELAWYRARKAAAKKV